MAAEILAIAVKAIEPSAASMGPQLIGCGDATGACAVLVAQGASMGPQLIGCGDTRIIPAVGHLPLPLQWGRS